MASTCCYRRVNVVCATTVHLERMLNMARMAGDKEMVRKLTPKKDLRTIKRELISSIRHGRIEPDLWNMYVETMTSQAMLPTLQGVPASV